MLNIVVRNKLGTEATKALLQVLESQTSLTRLNLSIVCCFIYIGGNLIGPEGVKSFNKLKQ